LLLYHATPVQEITACRTFDKKGVQVLVKREDLNHPEISGNKWWKLKYNLDAVLESGHKTILTFGGAFSNHIYATAAAARELKLKSVGIVRGEHVLPLNATLSFAVKQGMKIHYISRDSYRNKMSSLFVEDLHEQFGPFYLLPEGGSNLLAVKGCAEFAANELKGIGYDYLGLPIGTGSTMAGLIAGLKDTKTIFGVSVLKNGEFLVEAVRKMATELCEQDYQRWSILTNYHLGGYAKATNDLLSFIKEMKSFYDIPLDPVYTGKLFWAVFREIEAGSFPRGSTILLLHTGGLQGTASSETRLP
jgi:1-aminocyclopropane-1-carboxylate deaminase